MTLTLRSVALGLVLAVIGVLTALVLFMLLKPKPKIATSTTSIVHNADDDDAGQRKKTDSVAKDVVIVDVDVVSSTTPRSRTTAENILVETSRRLSLQQQTGTFSLDGAPSPTAAQRRRSSLTATTTPASGAVLERKGSLLSSLTRGVLRGSPPLHSAALQSAAPLPPPPTEALLPGSPRTSADTKHAQYPAMLPIQTLDGHFDSVESLAFSQTAEEGLFATGGGPEDGFIRVYDKGGGQQQQPVGELRHIINVRADCQKFDSAHSLAFALDEGRKTTLLLCGTKTERFLMGYKISRSKTTLPQLMFCLPTNHGAPVSSLVGFIPKTAINYADPGVFFATSALGTREVKLWTIKGGAQPVLVVDTECWASQLRLSQNGKHLAVLSRGGGPGQVFEIKLDPKSGNLKAIKQRLSLPIDGQSPPPPPSQLPPPMSPPTARLAKASEFQVCQDLHFSSASAAAACTVACCRSDSAVWVGTAALDASTWEELLLAKPDCLSSSSAQPPSQLIKLVNNTNRQTRVLVAKAKDVYFFDHALTLLGVLRGRREDSDVVGMELSPSGEVLVVVAFGGSVARVVAVP